MRLFDTNLIHRLLRGIPAFLLASFLLVSGCGQNGPLFLPDDQSSEADSDAEEQEEKKEESTE